MQCKPKRRVLLRTQGDFSIEDSNLDDDNEDFALVIQKDKQDDEKKVLQKEGIPPAQLQEGRIRPFYMF